MTPIELWIDGLENRYWQVFGRLRGPMDDAQISGDGFCALGVLCDLFLKHAPEEAAQAKARWDRGNSTFIWEENGIERKQYKEDAVPTPVLKWWNRFHAIDLSGIVRFNDKEHRFFEALAMYLRGAAGLHYVSKR